MREGIGSYGWGGGVGGSSSSPPTDLNMANNFGELLSQPFADQNLCNRSKVVLGFRRGNFKTHAERSSAAKEETGRPQIAPS